MDWRFICPVCGENLQMGEATAVCLRDGRVYDRVDGIWRFLPPERQAVYAQFIREYETVRAGEGRGSEDPAYYRALPFADLTGQMDAMWAVRAQSFRALAAKVVDPIAQKRSAPLRIVDVGAGNGWLSYRLARRGHAATAVDLLVNEWDGLAAAVHYDAAFTPIQAEFSRIPLAGGQADLVIFNASFHYATDYRVVLGEAKRLLRTDGRVIIMDTPLYHRRAAGEQMVREREAAFRTRYGFPSNTLPSRNFLTTAELAALAPETGFAYRLVWPISGRRRRWRRLKSAVRRQREPAQFPIIVLTRTP